MLNLKAPVSVVWEVTNNCNFLCPHCRAYCIHEEDNEEIENRIVSEIIKAKVLAVNISGGEPLLNIERTLEFAKIARKYFPLSDIRVLTNGLLVPKTPKYFFDELSKINVTIHLSIYPVTEKILDKIISKFKESNVNYYIAGGGKKEVFYKRLTLESDNDENYNNRNCILLIEGHADIIGSNNTTINYNLSERRASVIRDVILSSGFSYKRVHIFPYSDIMPKYTTNIHLNRRVDFVAIKCENELEKYMKFYSNYGVNNTSNDFKEK